MVKVSVIIPTYNRSERLSDAVDSVIAQTFQDIELIIIDDGSTDLTSDLIKTKHAGFPILYIRQPRQGVSAARNLGLSYTTGEYVCFLDSDDFWYPQKLQIQLAVMEQNQRIKISQVQEIWIRNGKQVNPMKKHLKPSGDIFIPSLKLCLVSPSAVMIEKKLFSEIGPFDETMPVCEDYDLWLRIAFTYDVLLIDDKLIEKRGGHEDQLSRQYWGMDRFRIYSMEKFLKKDLSSERRFALYDELRIKTGIVCEGSLSHRRYLQYLRYLVSHLRYRFLQHLLKLKLSLK